MKLSGLIKEKGKRIQAERNTLIPLSPPGKMWLVADNKMDIFCMRKNPPFMGHREYLFTVTEGNYFFSVNGGGRDLEWAATGYQGSSIVELDSALVFGSENLKPFRHELETAVGNWLRDLYSPVLPDHFPFHPLSPAEILQRPGVQRFEKGTQAVCGSDPLWITIQNGSAFLFNEPDYPLDKGTRSFHLIPDVMIQFPEECGIEVSSLGKMMERERFLDILGHFHSVILDFTIRRSAERQKKEEIKLEKKDSQEDAGFSQSIRRLSKINRLLPNDIADSYGTHLEKVVRQLEKKYRFPLNIPMTENGDVMARIRDSHTRKREVLLQGRWWKTDHGPILGFTDKNEIPVALIPVNGKRYKIYDPVLDETKDVDAQVAESLKPFGFTFYRSFPTGMPAGKDLLQFGLKSLRAADLLSVILIGFAGAVLGLAIPIITGKVFDVVLPGAYRDPMITIGIFLMLLSVTLFIFHFTRNSALLRIETLTDHSLQSAVWDRLLSLPATFFKKFTIGDLAGRANSLGEIRERLSQNALSSIVSGVFSVFTLLLLFLYNSPLAVIAVSLSLLFSLLFFLISAFSLRYERKIKDLDGKISGILFQIINGIGKIRISGSEKRTFSLWEKNYSRKNILVIGLKTLNTVIRTVQSVFPILTSMILYFFFLKYVQTEMTVGSFLAFNAAFASFMVSLLSITDTFLIVLDIIPLYERAKPIFLEQPEVDETKADPGELSGAIEVRNVTFRYSRENPPVLKNVNLSVRKGELVAIAGSSGSGKSTLFRILLGMEKPDSGEVFYDGQNLDSLDIRKLRQKTGVVLQNGKVMAGDIFSNIIGHSSRLTLEDAWEAAEMAGLAEDIRKMPMEMHTIVNEGGTTFSEGQRHRLLIASAIVRKPAIFFFDEATSALDNRTQAVVMESIERIRATRVIIAHRLSTIVHADRILVLDKGEIIQAGTYEELLDQEGLFRELVKRQMV